MIQFCKRKAGFSYLILITLVSFTTSALALTFPGKGTADDPYRISTVEELTEFRIKVNSVITNQAYKSYHYQLMNDIVMPEDLNWTPVGNFSYKFEGVFNGNGFAIKNLRIGSLSSYYNGNFVGFFGNLKNATVKNLTIRYDTIYSRSEGVTHYCGGLTGFASGSVISNCKVSGVFFAEGTSVYAGGIVGKMQETSMVNECYVNSEIMVKISNIVLTGGIAGSSGLSFIYNSASNCDMVVNYANDSPGTSYDNKMGGIAGEAKGVFNCYSTGSIKSEVTCYAIGGIVADADILLNNYAANKILANYKAQYMILGGVCGFINSKTDTVQNNIALNDSIIGITKDQSVYYICRVGLDYFNNFNSSVRNNYATPAMVLRNGTETTILTTTLLTGMESNDGLPLTDQPVDLLNGYVTANPLINGVSLLRWKVIQGVNGGLPVHENYVTSTESKLRISDIQSFVMVNKEIRFTDSDVESFQIFDSTGRLVYTGKVKGENDTHLFRSNCSLIIISCKFKHGEIRTYKYIL